MHIVNKKQSNKLSKGFIYLWMLFAVALAGIVLAGTGQIWQVQAQREKEKELLLIGEQFRRAFMTYYNDASSGAREYPDSLDKLLLDKRSPIPKRHLRKIFIDPMTKTTDWVLIEEPEPTGPGARAKTGFIGVHSLSKNVPIKTDNFPEHYISFREAVTYQDWQFMHAQEDTSSSPPSPSQTNPAAAGGSPFGSASSQSGSGAGAGAAIAPSSSAPAAQNPFGQ